MVDHILEILQIPKHFPDFNLEYLRLILDLNSTLKSEVLEFYGDQALDLIVTDSLIDFYGLNTTPHDLTNRKSNVVRNTTLSGIASQLHICLPHYTMKKCADTLEAIIGALYFQYRIPGLSRIKAWFLGIPSVRNTILKNFPKPSYRYIGSESSEIRRVFPSCSWPKSLLMSHSVNDVFIIFRDMYCQNHPEMEIGIEPNRITLVNKNQGVKLGLGSDFESSLKTILQCGILVLVDL